MSTFTKYVLTFLVSMVPLIELRLGVPIGVKMIGTEEWPKVLIVSMIGNMLPVPVIFFFAKKVLIWGSDKKFIGKFFTWCLEKGRRGGEKLQAKAGKGVIFLYIGLLFFVGIPVPGTGAWTGTLAASMLDLDFKKSVIAVMCGVLLAGTIITIASVLGFSLIGG